MTTTRRANTADTGVGATEDTERFLRAILPARTDAERYRLEFFGDSAPRLSATSKNYLDIKLLAKKLVDGGKTSDAYAALATYPEGGDDRLGSSALRVGAAWADLDVGTGKPYASKQAALDRIENFQLPPTAVVDSGNGIHAYWTLDQPTDDLDRVLAIVRGLAEVLDGDPKVALRSQVMRVPGTFNRKAKNGGSLPVRLISTNDSVYSIDAFTDVGVPEIGVPPTASREPVELGAPSGLPVGTRAWRFIAAGAPTGEQRGEAVAVARSLIGAGYSVDDTAGYIWKGLQASPNDPADPWTFDDAIAITRDIASRPAPALRYRKAHGDGGRDAEGEQTVDHGDFPLTDLGNAELFAIQHGDRIRYDHKRQRSVIFGVHHWREDVDREISRLAFETARLRKVLAANLTDADKSKKAFAWAIQSESRSRVDAMVEFAKALPPIADRGDGWDSDPDLLGVPNGVVDLRTGRLRPGAPSDRITLVAPVAYDAAAIAPTWERAIDAMMEGDTELLSFLQAACGYSITGHTREQVLFMAHGNGANGKSTFLNIVRTVAGEYGHNLPFTALEQSARSQAIPADIAQLPGRRLVTSSETSDSTRLYESRIKALTGSDPITAAEKFKAPFTFQPVAKLWLATNHLPTVRDDSHGFWRRMRVIPFRHQFSGDELDPGLEAKLQRELPGVLRWMVEGAVRWYREGLSAPERVMLATEEYRTDSDPLADFIAERCLLSAGAQTAAAELYKMYLSWANEHSLGRETLTPSVFGRRMSERFERVHTRGGKVYRGVGIAFDVTGSGSGDGFEVGFESFTTPALQGQGSTRSRHNPSPGGDNQSSVTGLGVGDGFGGHFPILPTTHSPVGGDSEKPSQPVTPSHPARSARCLSCDRPVTGGHVRCDDCARTAHEEGEDGRETRI